jgi:hypothetical protein
VKNSGNDPHAEALSWALVVILSIYICTCVGAIVVGILDTVL